MKEAIVKAFEESVRVKQAFLRDNLETLMLAIDAIVAAFKTRQQTAALRQRRQRRRRAAYCRRIHQPFLNRTAAAAGAGVDHRHLGAHRDQPTITITRKFS